jgi:hypothetical protein
MLKTCLYSISLQHILVFGIVMKGYQPITCIIIDTSWFRIKYLEGRATRVIPSCLNPIKHCCSFIKLYSKWWTCFGLYYNLHITLQHLILYHQEQSKKKQWSQLAVTYTNENAESHTTSTTLNKQNKRQQSRITMYNIQLTYRDLTWTGWKTWRNSNSISFIIGYWIAMATNLRKYSSITKNSRYEIFWMW